MSVISKYFGIYKGLEFIALFVLIYLVLDKFLVKNLSDLVWIMSINMAYFGLNAYRQVLADKELAKEFDRLNAEIDNLKKSLMP